MAPHESVKKSNKKISDEAEALQKYLELKKVSVPSLKNLTAINYGRPADKHNAALKSLGKHHVGSFNYMLDEGLKIAVQDIDPIEFIYDATGQKIKLWLVDARLEPPSVPPGTYGIRETRVWPTEARQRGCSYKGKFTVRAGYSIDGVNQPIVEKNLGNIPVMLGSDACNLRGFTPAQLVERGEQETEWGGYFIIGGHERIIRMLQTTRRNYPIAMQRGSWKKRGKNFSDLGVQIDCGKRDLTTVKNVIHFVVTGTAKYMFNVGKELFFVPAMMILKCLTSRSDADIYAKLVQGTDPEDHYFRGCIHNMLAEPQEEGLYSSDQIREFIGANFREKVRYLIPDWCTNQDVCDYLISHSVLVHLNNKEDKFNLVVFMLKKLFSLAQDKCVVEGVDSVMMHEIVLGGHLYLQLLKEKLEVFLQTLKSSIVKKAKATPKVLSVGAVGHTQQDLSPAAMQGCLQKTLTLEKMFENFVGTGNLPSKSGLGLMQDKGLTIMAENINRMRYMSHFRAIHRGSFFMEMRTTEVRVLLPDAWGFVCPVHTPDGAPCGLLNHLAMPVEIVTHPVDGSSIPQVLADLGMIPLEDKVTKIKPSSYSVMLDGKVLGFVSKKDAPRIVDKLRILKIKKEETRVPNMTEIAFIPSPQGAVAGQYPGIFIFTGAARMMRPVFNIAAKAIEYIGTLEQVYLDVAITPSETYQGLTTHLELSETAFLSNLAQTIPLPDFNQSPRNMYQCQMGKQTMASPTHTWHLTSETKLYRLQTPTSPFFRPAHYDTIGMDDYPMGTNAVVAVISYTGYDMEDAMIINKSSYERGFAAGMIYKAQFVDLFQVSTGKKARSSGERDKCDLVFDRDPKNPALAAFLDSDGLPYIGSRLSDKDPFYCYRNDAEGVYVVKKFEGKEVCYVDAVKLCGNETGSGNKNRVCISLRVPRNPNVGDKFASRAGQKGICSRKWPCEDLPWTESGLVPDVVFNPHGFPSRMTIAMMIEMLAGKSAALHGLVHDATPFKFSEDDDAIDHFAKQLETAGFNYYGTETMYSGTDGVEMTADIFFGIVHYQRLRHMVSDKFQVRNQGPIDQVTRQPIKGRRRGGGVRFGEMERDCLLSHGTTFLLQDRLFHGSDKTLVKVCTKCGSLLSPRVSIPVKANSFNKYREYKSKCVICKETGESSVKVLQVPHIFVHLVNQLSSVNIKILIKTESF